MMGLASYPFILMGSEKLKTGNKIIMHEGESVAACAQRKDDIKQKKMT